MKNIWQELLKTAKIIDGWSNKQRKDYLKRLKKREKQKEKTLYRNIIKLMLINREGRKSFIKTARQN